MPNIHLKQVGTSKKKVIKSESLSDGATSFVEHWSVRMFSFARKHDRIDQFFIRSFVVKLLHTKRIISLSRNSKIMIYASSHMMLKENEGPMKKNG